jgi:hypothetical protein
MGALPGRKPSSLTCLADAAQALFHFSGDVSRGHGQGDFAFELFEGFYSHSHDARKNLREKEGGAGAAIELRRKLLI